MENQSCLLKKISKLQNININELLFYAFHRELISNEFLIEYALDQLERTKTKDPFILELAGLLHNETMKASELLVAKIANKEEVFTTNGQKYNEVWFYLILAAQMCAKKIIE